MTADSSNVPFSFTFTASGQFVVAEAGPSALHTFVLGAAGSLASASSSVTDGQLALCWITAAGGYDYVANAGSNSVSAFSVAANGTPSLVGTTGIVGTTDAGPIDMAASADGSTLYVEAGGAGAVDEFHLNAGGSLSDLGSVAGLVSASRVSQPTERTSIPRPRHRGLSGRDAEVSARQCHARRLRGHAPSAL